VIQILDDIKREIKLHYSVVRYLCLHIRWEDGRFWNE